ncbi:MAG: hypothetical protein JNN23_04890 [Chryseobacterium gambrini]|nr:hypothetical protein [Chryseobacterium gambrini]
MRININFNQTGGVPITNDLMSVIMEAIETYNVLADVAGDLTILSGCTQSGSTVSPGYVVVNGDVLYFEGGTLNSTVFVESTDNVETFQDQIDRVLWTEKTLKFGLSTPPNLYNWGDFVRLDSLKVIKNKVDQAATQAQVNTINNRLDLLELKTAPIVNGGVVMIWRKPQSEIPLGWKPCLDIRGKTVFGYDPNTPPFNNLGANIGSSQKTILKANLPNVGLNYEDVEPGNPDWGGGGFDGGNNHFVRRQKTTAPMGSGQPFDVLNPGIIVDFIEPDFQ